MAACGESDCTEVAAIEAVALEEALEVAVAWEAAGVDDEGGGG